MTMVGKKKNFTPC